MKKILLTGATGLIGRAVGKLLVETGYEVISVSRNTERAKSLLPFQTKVISWDLENGFHAHGLDLLQDVDAVINLMGESLSEKRWSNSFKKSLFESRVDATEMLIEQVYSHAEPKVWIQGSAIGYYGSTFPSDQVDERGVKGEGFLADLCEDWEGTLSALPRETRPVVMRTGVVFSHQGGAFPKMHTPLMTGVGGIIADGKQSLSLIHLEDIARFILFSVESENVRGVYNLVSEETVTQKELTGKIANRLHLHLGPHVPAFALKLMLGEMSELILQSQAVFSTRLKEAGYLLKYPTIDSILNEVSSWYLNPLVPNHSTYLEFTEQYLPVPREKLFSFFSDAKNLELLTPEFLHFKIKEVSTSELEQNTKISYQLKLHGVPFSWLTDILVWDPPHRFVDNQLSGPYSLWYHEHTFLEVQGGTLIRDWVRFSLPGGKLGSIVGLAKVRSEVEAIFQYRRAKITEIFGS